MDEAKIYESILKREFERFSKALEETGEDLIGQIAESGDGINAIREKQGHLSLAESILKTAKSILEKMDSLFKESDGRRNWEKYLSGLRMIAGKFPISYFARMVLSMFGLDDAGKKLFAYCDELKRFMGLAHKVLATAEEYLLNLGKGAEIQETYQVNYEGSNRLYASLKTWGKDKKLEKFMTRYESFVGEAFKVIILGPVQLYLMLSPETFLLVFKLLTVGKLRDLSGNSRDYDDIMALSGLIHDLVKNSKALNSLQEIFGLATEKYLELLKKEQAELRSIVPRQGTKTRYITTYEEGKLFIKEESH